MLDRDRRRQLIPRVERTLLALEGVDFVTRMGDHPDGEAIVRGRVTGLFWSSPPEVSSTGRTCDQFSQSPRHSIERHRRGMVSVRALSNSALFISKLLWHLFPRNAIAPPQM